MIGSAVKSMAGYCRHICLYRGGGGQGLVVMLLLLLVPAVLCAATGQETPETDKGIFSLTFENDKFAHFDDNYTNGVRISWLSGINDVPHLLRTAAARSPLFPDHGDSRIEYAAGQSMYTPGNIKLVNPPLTDRPYAGWLYGSVGVISENGIRLHQLELKLGVVGPSSKAEEAQKFVHEYISDSPEPMGWHTQLPDEPGIQLTYQRSWRAVATTEIYDFGIDFTPTSAIALGTVFDYVEAGAMVRMGKDLCLDYGPPRVQPSPPGSSFFTKSPGLSGYVFGGVTGRLVAHDLFLDGSFTEDSRSVEKEYFVVDLIAGAALTWKNIRFTYTHTYRTPEFEAQHGLEQYGSMTLSIKF
ncbi:MAG: lipid A deacylase LpxR family protein [Thermodesulfobacteriota bacterium]|nr:lipid A deacylase LpxR family protein [Thermodesulfobacteriota bacterium]